MVVTQSGFQRGSDNLASLEHACDKTEHTDSDSASTADATEPADNSYMSVASAKCAKRSKAKAIAKQNKVAKIRHRQRSLLQQMKMMLISEDPYRPLRKAISDEEVLAMAISFFGGHPDVEDSW